MSSSSLVAGTEVTVGSVDRNLLCSVRTKERMRFTVRRWTYGGDAFAFSGDDAAPGTLSLRAEIHWCPKWKDMKVYHWRCLRVLYPRLRLNSFSAQVMRCLPSSDSRKL